MAEIERAPFYEKIEGKILSQTKAAGASLISQAHTTEKSFSVEQCGPVRL